MSSTATKNYAFDMQDIEYLRHGDEPLLARWFQPRGDGPFPAMIEVHGGAWTNYDRTRGKSLHEALARSGVVVLSLDFRQGKSGPFPCSSADINYGIRWLKANAARFKIRADRVGISGNSSGGQLVMLGAMKPHDARFTNIPLAAGSPNVDATVGCVVMLWPVINPFGRYRMAKRELAKPNPRDFAARLIKSHDDYWGSEAIQREANPMLMLERQEKVLLPPAMWIQATQDDVHNYVDEESGKTDAAQSEPEAERFAGNYRKAGGEFLLKYYDAPSLFTTVHPTLPESIAALDDIVAFVHQHIGLRD
ncbi:MAG: alpha/beta hydrolase [Burkholderiales bacterium]